ncbi:HAD family hydrolase [Paenibacillus lutrae]|uniref:HAD-IA family hydrolase n=1 Tax=Paenibacillus lutrae TaxID=2078573 RepID=A0A7X3JXP2_9BACL|nr:HAD family hydrolase [Paenibacillus lutrae]MVO98074.1 HAD-IA family hydrolase [Paenibacillus lutrae]
MVTGVLFDLDGTLLDRNLSLLHFADAQYDSLFTTYAEDKQVFINRFIELDQRGYVWKDKVYQHLIEEYRLPYTWEELLDDYLNGFPKYAVSFPHTLPLLESLKKKGYKLGMITNGFKDFQSANIDALGIRSCFHDILISEQAGLRKPDPAIFRMAAERLQIKLDNCVYIGDHPVNDVAASRYAGMRGIWKEDNYYPDDFEYDGIVRDLLELEPILDKWTARI